MDTTKYPIGTQTFQIIRERNFAYADKTEYIYRLTQSGSRICFLSRPRRFGKSLLLSTIEAYFKGKKELFEGLAIYELEKDWQQYPVLRFDFAGAEANNTELLRKFIYDKLKDYAQDYEIDVDLDCNDTGNSFGKLIKGIYRKTSQKVVVLIDEYDRGLIEILNNAEKLEANQDLLRGFYSQLKAQDEYIKFAMLTGVSRFRHLTIFSGFNNIYDISLNPKYAGICGFTKDEITNLFESGIRKLASSLSLSLEETVEQLRLKYDGYRFSSSELRVFNPFSLLTCLSDSRLGNFWLKSGTSKVFIEYLSKSDFDITSIEDIWAEEGRMDGTYSTEDPVPLLYQTGYLTIKDVKGIIYKLGIPNGEVRKALVDDLAPVYLGVKRNDMALKLYNIAEMVNEGDADGFLRELQSMIGSVPFYEMDLENLERTYHLIIYMLFLILDIDAHCEIAMSGGRIDMVVKTTKYIYVMEFKLGGTTEEALNQIEDRCYALPWSADKRKLYKIGIVFSPQTRTIAEWKVIG